MTDYAEETLEINDREVESLLHGRLGDPFSFLGPHPHGEYSIVRTFHPGARAVDVLLLDNGVPRHLESLYPLYQCGLFVSSRPVLPRGARYMLRIVWPDRHGSETVQITEDPYSFGLLLGELDMHLLAEGRHRELARCLGANPMTVDGVHGTRFAVWAPNARRVSVVGDFNQWDGRRHAMRLRIEAGVWELFIPRLPAGTRYMYEIVGPDDKVLPLKADPVARFFDVPPGTCSVVASEHAFTWTDAAWLAERARRQAPDAPISVYEVHAGSWLRKPEEGDRSLNWHELADRLIPYAKGLGFTHIEFLPIMEHPFGGSWGYQPLGLFAPSARFGTPTAFAAFVDRCHAAGLGVILDWVPAHFPSDPHGLARFDGTALYEHQDPREGLHQDWNTLIYNLGRNEVVGFLIASALEWLEHFHVDGLRVDAVASMLYRDYSRKEGEWVPNVYGGRENLEAVAFLRELNRVVHERCPGVITIAEESTAWPGVTAPLDQGGLGFSYKWNMGWMHDTLRYMGNDPIHRRHHHHDMSFSMIYAYSERFMLPISHDEVVHGKGSLLNKMPGDLTQKLANLRAYLGYMWTHPGRKLLFMGSEIAQHAEWNHDATPDWNLLDVPQHRGVQRLVRDLNRLYVREPALHARDDEPNGFAWVVGDDSANSVFAFLRCCEGHAPLLVICNMTPVRRAHYRLGVPAGGGGSLWQPVLDTDLPAYREDSGSCGVLAAADPLRSQAAPSHGHPHSLVLDLPPLATLILKRVG